MVFIHVYHSKAWLVDDYRDSALETNTTTTVTGAATRDPLFEPDPKSCHNTNWPGYEETLEGWKIVYSYPTFPLSGFVLLHRNMAWNKKTFLYVGLSFIRTSLYRGQMHLNISDYWIHFITKSQVIQYIRTPMNTKWFSLFCTIGIEKKIPGSLISVNFFRYQ